MKVYLIEKDNCESYEDYYSWIETGFTSYRLATEYLLNREFVICIDLLRNNKEEDLKFYWQEDESRSSFRQGARIIEVEIFDEFIKNLK